MNFELTGFRVSGVVSAHSECASSAKPHVGLTVELFNTNNELTATASTQAGTGAFVFENVLPGTYSLHAAGAVVPITVIGSNLEVRPNVFVPGYALKGYVATNGASSSSEMEVVLYSRTTGIDSRIKCESAQNAKFASSEAWGHAVCVVKTNAGGHFEFPVVPCGTFVVAPSASIGSDSDAYSFDNAYQQVTIDATAKTLPKGFSITGVSVRGKVVSAKSKPIADARVTLTTSNGASLTATTDSDGSYAFKSVPVGKAQVEAEKSGITFAKQSFSASASSRVVPDFVASKIDVCGKVSIPYPPNGVSGGARRRISLQNADGSGSKLSATTDEHGEFCFQLTAESRSREVTVSVQTTSFERDSGLIMTTTENTVSVDTLPVLNIHFAQSLLRIRGRITCLGSQSCADSQTNVQLTPVSHDGESATVIASRSPQDTFASFEFPLLIPGKYLIKMEKPEWCWAQEAIEVELKDSNFDFLEFTHTGYNVRISSTHDVELHYQLPSTTGTSSLHVKRDPEQPNAFCLPSSGTYSFRVVSELYQFEKDSYTFSTSDLAAEPASTLRLVAKKVKVSGKIVIDASLSSSHGTVAQFEVVSSASPSSSSKGPHPITFTNEARQTGSNDIGLEYFVWASAGDELKISASSKDGAVLYYPTSVTSKIASLNPGLVLPSIHGRPGLFISGSVSPALPDVVVTIFDESDDSVVIGNIATDSRGTYKAGPLLDTSSYKVSASAPGFHLVQQEESESGSKYVRTVNFRASKLGSLTARAQDVYGAPIAGAILSLSGAGGYRANNATNEQGEVVFSNIFPGDYYLMPLLKEYTFAKDAQPAQVPKHQQPIAVAVKEGADSLRLVGSRIAYSVFGRVSSLNGQPERGVVVEARSVVAEGANSETAQQLEKATTDQSGNYRIRGLLPGQSYHIKLATGETAHVDRTSPESYPATVVGTSDLRDLDFLAFRKSAIRFELFGRVLTNSSLLQYLTVQLFEEDATAEPVRELKLHNGANFFTFAGLAKTQYTLKVKLDAALNRAAPNTISVAQLERAVAKISFAADSASQHVDLHLESLSTEHVVEVPEGQLFATLLVIAIALGLYNRKSLTKRFKAYREGSSEVKNKKSKRVPVEDQFVANLNKYGRG